MIQTCEDCKAPCDGEFRKVVGLRNSGLLIFLHKEKRKAKRVSTKLWTEESFILHNAGDKQLKRADYIVEMCQYRTKCFQCKTVLQRVRSLLDEITDIKKNEVLGICEHCKRANPAGKCRRCEFIVNKFLCNKVKQYEDKQNRFKTWITKVNQLLHNVLESENVCKHKLYKESSTLELEKLLQELKNPLEMRQPDITFFPTEPGPFSSLTQSKEMLEELLIKLKSESLRIRSSDDSLFVSPSMTSTNCVCKYFMDKNFEGRPSIEVLPKQTLSVQHSVEPKLDSKTRINVSRVSRESVVKTAAIDKDIITTKQKVKDTPSKEKAKAKSSKEKTPGKENVSPDKEPKQKTPKEAKTPKPKRNSEEELMLKMMKARDKEKKTKEKAVKEKVKEFAKIESLPQLMVREAIEVVEDKSDSVVECGHHDTLPFEMIRGNKVVPFNPHYKDKPLDTRVPLLFQTVEVFPELKAKTSVMSATTTSATTTNTVDKGKKSKSKQDQEVFSNKGIIKYELSNREFIEKGWTILPTTKMLRRMNIYKMEPACPKYDWFEQHKYRKLMFYSTSEKLAEIEDSGRGKWFYKNGSIALDYYNSQELNAGQRYVVYSSGEEVANGKVVPVTVLASFDFLGNGVVYDCFGNVRLKYNQTEGIVIDPKIGPPGRWKWHSLNEPPVLQPVFVDTHVRHRNACVDYLLEHQKEDKFDNDSKQERPLNSEMLAIEFENFVKEKATKLLQKFKPFQIRMKALKVNEQFSLRVLDQANIYLLFREGQVSLKLNLGMLLISSEIIDTDTAEVSEVSTPYDRIPPKTASVAEIQHTLNKARRIGEARNKVNTEKITVSKSSI